MRVMALSDVGRVRSNNEDVFRILEDQMVFIVCDGMGGHQAGEIAAEIAAKDLSEVLSQPDALTPANFKEVIPDLLKGINTKIMSMSSENDNYRNMGTTMVLAKVIDQVLYVANVGDSRCYILRDGVLNQISKDHSLVAELVKIGSISASEAENHPDKNIITSALGVDEAFDIFMDEVSLTGVSHILLCSDGLSNMLSSQQITDLLEVEPFEKVVEKLVQTANELGGQDNITVICIEI